MHRLLLRGGSPLAVGLTVLVTPVYAVTPPPMLLSQIKDECNPATFNVAVAPGTCGGKVDGVGMLNFRNS